MVKNIKEYDEEHREKVFLAVDKYAKFCKDLNLNETSMYSLLGISRQSWINYKSRKTQPSAGVMTRMRIVLEILTDAHKQGIVPTASSRNQGTLVDLLLSLK